MSKTFHVSAAAGKDYNCGSESAPFKSINKAASTHYLYGRYADIVNPKMRLTGVTPPWSHTPEPLLHDFVGNENNFAATLSLNNTIIIK